MNQTQLIEHSLLYFDPEALVQFCPPFRFFSTLNRSVVLLRCFHLQKGQPAHFGIIIVYSYV